MDAILESFPSRFWLYAAMLSFVVGLMTGAAGLPWWGGAVASVIAVAVTVAVILLLRAFR